MINSVVENSIYMTVKEIAEITSKPVSTLKDRCLKNKYICRLIAGKRGGNGGKQYEILVSSLEPELQEVILNHLSLAGEPLVNPLELSSSINARFSLETNHSIGGDVKSKDADTKIEFAPVSLTLHTKSLGDEPPKKSSQNNIIPFSLFPKAPAIPTVPEKAKKLALAKVDIINHWESYRNGQKNKKQADKDFIEMYNGKILSKTLYNIVGKVSLATLYRWNKDLKENNNNYTALIPNYNYGSESVINTKLTKIEQSMFVDLMLRPSKMAIGKAREIVGYILKRKGYEIASYPTYKRYAAKIRRNFNDIWVLMREGEKALKDKVAPYIMRDASVLNVGDVLIADGNTLDFQVINPFTGKPCRATMIVYLDWKSEDVAGYEIMLTENTQCIASALRNAILSLGKIPTICYQDNGTAFRSKFFRGNADFEESGFYGLFGSLGIIPVFATPYNARAKIVERFFREFTQSCASLMPSYIGNCIDNKPAYMKRNEKFHKSIHNNVIPTIEQAVAGINAWLDFYRSRPCPNMPEKTIGEVFNEGRGDGVDIELLDDLMMAQEERKICRNGVRMFNTYYWHEKLYSINDTVIVKYSLLDITKIKVYSKCGDFICTAETVKECHPMAGHLGDATDVYSLKQAMKRNKNMINQTMKAARGLIPQQTITAEWQEVKPSLKPAKKQIKKKKYNLFSSEIELPRLEEKKYKLFN